MTQTRILIVDQDESTRELLRSSLNQERFEVHWASSVEGAIQILERHKNWAILLLNVWLPGKDGFSLIREWKNKDPETRFVLLSKEGNKEEVLKALKMGVSDYFEKPFQVQEVVQCLETLSRNYLSRKPITVLTPDPRPTHGTHLKLVRDNDPHLEEVRSEEQQSYTVLKRQWAESFEKDYLSKLLNSFGGNVSAAARHARVDRSNFLRLLRKHGLKAEIFRKAAA